MSEKLTYSVVLSFKRIHKPMYDFNRAVHCDTSEIILHFSLHLTVKSK